MKDFSLFFLIKKKLKIPKNNLCARLVKLIDKVLCCVLRVSESITSIKLPSRLKHPFGIHVDFLICFFSFGYDSVCQIELGTRSPVFSSLDLNKPCLDVKT